MDDNKGVWYFIGGGQLLDDFIFELKVIRDRWDIPWCIKGDFNEVLFLDKRNRATRRTRGWMSLGILWIRMSLLMSLCWVLVSHGQTSKSPHL